MPILVDTNVLLRSLHPEHHHFPIALHALAMLRRRDRLCVAPQNLIEFWAVATRSSNERGLGMTHVRGAAEIHKIRRLFYLLHPNVSIVGAWQKLVLTSGISGKRTHDAHLAATMRVHAVDRILTFNMADFESFPGIAVLDPAKV